MVILDYSSSRIICQIRRLKYEKHHSNTSITFLHWHAQSIGKINFFPLINDLQLKVSAVVWAEQNA
jgi:hypothetical protein